MAKKSIFYSSKKGLIRTCNADGSFLLQFLIIGLEGTNAFDEFLYEALTITLDWMRMNPMNNILKGALINNFLCGFVYNTSITLKFLED